MIYIVPFFERCERLFYGFEVKIMVCKKICYTTVLRVVILSLSMIPQCLTIYQKGNSQMAIKGSKIVEYEVFIFKKSIHPIFIAFN